MSRWFALVAAVLITGCQSTMPAGTITRERIAEIVALGVDRARLNRAVFAALKPGGSYVRETGRRPSRPCRRTSSC
jgi:predicted methyltransferase